MGMDRILAALDRHTTIFDLDKNGLGETLTQEARDGIATNFRNQTSPTGERWPALSSDYARWKERFYPGRPMGIKEGNMFQGLEGITTVTITTAQYQYGQGDLQREEATWFQEGDAATNRPPRPFVGLSDEIKFHNAVTLADHLKENL